MPELHVSKKTIGKLFSEMQNRKFVIPDYQRPYKWDVEKCETLWGDIENFAQTDAKVGADYFLGTIVSYIEPDDEVSYSISTEARKYLHCLSCYPNEFWKYATSVFFLKNQNKPNFDTDFIIILKKIIAFLFAKFIEAPTVNAIGDDIYKIKT